MTTPRLIYTSIVLAKIYTLLPACYTLIILIFLFSSLQVQNAKEERVHLISIPRGVNHLLQPLDGDVNDNIRSMIMKRIRKWEVMLFHCKCILYVTSSSSLTDCAGI